MSKTLEGHIVCTLFLTHVPYPNLTVQLPPVIKSVHKAGQAPDQTLFSLHCRLVSSLSLKMTDPAVKRVVSDIIRSPEDKRVYRGLEFTNGLKAMLISDPTTDKSSAALDVHIGKGLLPVCTCKTHKHSAVYQPLNVTQVSVTKL